MIRWAEEIEKRRGKRIAIIALARKMAGIMYAIWRDGSRYEASRGATRPTPQPLEATTIMGVLADAASVNVLFIGIDRRLNFAWVVDGGIWQGPFAIGSPDTPYPAPGSGFAVAPQGANQFDAFFSGQDGGFYVA